MALLVKEDILKKLFISEMDTRVGSLIGLYTDDTDDHVYAFSTDRKSVLMSRDRGVNWASTPPRVVTENNNTLYFKSAVHVPWSSSIADDAGSSLLKAGKYSGESSAAAIN